jgi:RNA polymerase sigma-70 factor (ECF subfamily)
MESDLEQRMSDRARDGSAEQEARATLARALDGDRKAAVQLIDRFYQRIYAFLRRLTANDTEAADLTQRTFARLWQALPTFAGRSSVASWIHSIAYHIYVDWRRANHRTEQRSTDWWEARAATEAPPDEIVAQMDLARRIHRTVGELERELREAVHLHYYQELTLQETADAQGVATSTVKYRLRRALAELQKKFGGERAEVNSRIPSRII